VLGGIVRDYYRKAAKPLIHARMSFLRLRNAFAERWVRTVREECLDHLIILNERHLHRVLKEYCAYYNARRPHQGLEQDSPAGLEVVSTEDPIHCREVLGGVIRDYYQRAA
jgi:putative transposase